jgi:hypothetical protein
VARPALTVRHGSRVARERFETLEEAVDALRERAEAIRAEGELRTVSAIRDYEAAQQVHARLEISVGGRLRRREAGIDVMGDGSLVTYRGGISRRLLEPAEGESPYEAISAALSR